MCHWSSLCCSASVPYDSGSEQQRGVGVGVEGAAVIKQGDELAN